MVSEKALYRLKPIEIFLLYKMLWYHRLSILAIHELLKSENIYIDVNLLRRVLYKLERKGLIERRRTWEKVNGKYRRVILYSLSLDVKKSEKIKKMIEEIFYSVIYGISKEVR